MLTLGDPHIIEIKSRSHAQKAWEFLLLPKNCNSSREAQFSTCSPARRQRTPLHPPRGRFWGQVLGGGGSEWQPPPLTHPLRCSKQGNSLSVRKREKSLGAGPERKIKGFERPPIGGLWRTEDVETLIGPLPVHNGIDSSYASRRCAPPSRWVPALRSRARARAASEVLCLPVSLRTLVVSGRARSGGGHRR